MNDREKAKTVYGAIAENLRALREKEIDAAEFAVRQRAAWAMVDANETAADMVAAELRAP